jgi:hypothetical protein
MNEKLQAAFRGRMAEVEFLDGRKEEIKVRQLVMREYERAYPLREDEIALVAFICGKPTIWIEGKREDGGDGMAPESYEDLRRLAEEVNERGFFSFATRRAAREEAVTLRQMEAMRITPDMVVAAMQKTAQSPSPTGSPSVPPRPV